MSFRRPAPLPPAWAPPLRCATQARLAGRRPSHPGRRRPRRQEAGSTSPSGAWWRRVWSHRAAAFGRGARSKAGRRRDRTAAGGPPWMVGADEDVASSLASVQSDLRAHVVPSGSAGDRLEPASRRRDHGARLAASAAARTSLRIREAQESIGHPKTGHGPRVSRILRWSKAPRSSRASRGGRRGGRGLR